MMRLNSSSQIKIGAIMSYGMVGFNIIVGLLYTPWMINSIGKSDYGLYTLVISFLTYFVVDFGLWLAINKVISNLRAQNRQDEEKNVLGVATRIYLLLDCFACIAVIFVYFFIDEIFVKLTPAEIVRFKNAYIIAAIFSLLSFPFGFIKGVYNAHEFFVESKILDFLTRLCIILFTILLLSIGGGLYSLIFVYGAMPFVINIVRVIYLKSKGVEANFRAWDKKIAKEIWSISIWLFIVVLAELFINNLAPSLIGVFSGTSEIAIFGVGLSLCTYINSFATSISGLFLPKVTQLSVDGNTEELRNLSIRVGRIQLFIVGFVALGFILVGKDFMISWMDESYLDSYFVCILLIIPQILISIQQIESTTLLAINKIRYRSMCMLATSALSILLSFVFIPYYGAIGSAMSISIANIIFMFIGMNIVYKKTLNISFAGLLKGFSPIIGLYVLVVVFFYMIVNITGIDNIIISWRSFFVKGLLFVILYCPLVLFFLNKSERLLINNFLKKIKNVFVK